MAEFKTIETQEELERILGERLAREKEKNSKAIEGYENKIKAFEESVKAYEDKLAKSEATISSHQEEVAKLTAEISNLQLATIKHQIAHKNGLPYELAERLTGTDEESLTADALNLKKFVGAKTAPPLANPELPPENDKDAQFRDLARKL